MSAHAAQYREVRARFARWSFSVELERRRRADNDRYHRPLPSQLRLPSDFDRRSFLHHSHSY